MYESEARLDYSKALCSGGATLVPLFKQFINL